MNMLWDWIRRGLTPHFIFPETLLLSGYGPIFELMTSNAAQLQQELGSVEQVNAWLESIAEFCRSGQIDANDLVHRFEASADYDPAPGLEKIQASVLAINFADDE